MKSKNLKLIAIAFLVGCALPFVLLNGETSADRDESTPGIGFGTVENLEENYKNWEAEYVKSGGDRNVVLKLGAFKGLSTEETYATGEARLDLIEGRVTVEVSGLSKDQSYDVWLVDNGADSSVMPDESDALVRVGTLRHAGERASLEVSLGNEAFAALDPDLAIVTPAGKSPTTDRVLVGATTLFHRMYRSAQNGEFGILADAKPAASPARERNLIQRMIDAINPTAQAQIGPNPNPTTAQQILIAAGRQSFFNDTFNGNGRTCGTCHREDGNLTIDAEFIANLPPNDPLFVAEFVPALAANFENPVLMRKFGLILENVDGFNRPGVMRGVPHTLALLPNTLKPAPIDGTNPAVLERTGWSGDGAPGTGTLREFIIGAVTQHYPKSLNRTPGVDFTLPTVAQLDALEAFQKSLGRRQDLVLSGPGALSLKNEIARRGQQIFMNPGNVPGLFVGSNAGAGKCFLCHANAGGGDTVVQIILGTATAETNANFNTGVEDLPSQPADLVVPAQPNPPDEGFGQAPFPGGGFGDGTFNTPVLVEAADTGPFFHNNSIDTIEGAVAFYNSAAFNNSPIGPGVGGIQLEATEVVAVAAFLRVINALENHRSALNLINRARATGNDNAAKDLLKLALSELEDEIEVLDCGNLHPSTQNKLRSVAVIIAGAIIAPTDGSRDALIDLALPILSSARSEMVN